MWDRDFEDDEEVDSFRVTAGFIAFVTAMLTPALIAIVIFFAAWAVADEVYAAEGEDSRFANSACLNCEGEEVAGWKKSLVGICPLH